MHWGEEREPGDVGFVNPRIANLYINRNWVLDATLTQIFTAANITMSVRMEGRSRKSVVASFHSLRHTFVSLSANAGVPLPVVQSIVGHCSTAMTRHYYHENESALRAAVEAIPALGGGSEATGAHSLAVESTSGAANCSIANISRRLKRIDRMFAKGLISESEFATHRARILSEM
jgi:hypothetical protein